MKFVEEIFFLFESGGKGDKTRLLQGKERGVQDTQVAGKGESWARHIVKLETSERESPLFGLPPAA